jgi:hypothetical protein
VVALTAKGGRRRRPPAGPLEDVEKVLAGRREISVSGSLGPRHRKEGRSVGISRACFCWRADPLVDHLPDLLVQLVLLPDAVRGPHQHRRDRHQPDRPAHRRIDPLVAPQADAQLTFPGVKTTVSA